MPEIITHGPNQHEASCSKCWAKFRYKTKELTHNYIKGQDGVRCPACGEWHSHYAAKL